MDEIEARDDEEAEIGTETVRCVRDELVVAERESPALNEANLFPSFDGLLEGVELYSAEGGKRGGDIGPRSSVSRFWAAEHNVHGVECISPMWPQPLCCV